MTMEKGEVKMMQRSGLMLVVAVLLVLTGCRTATPRNWSYQWHPAQGVARVVRRHPASGMLGWSISEAIKEVENLGWVVSVDNFLKRDFKEGDVTVAFLVRPESVENEIVVYLSNTLAPDNDMVFYAPASIVEDVKAEVERQKALKG